MSETSESGRLAEVYSAMSDLKLAELVRDASSLTEAAQDAVAAEMQRRGLRPEDANVVAGHDEVEFQDLVTIRKFRDLPEALLAKGSLESAGVECYLTDDNMVRMDWFISNLLGGVKLNVKAEDASAAMEILNQPIPEGFDVEGSGLYQQPRCPACQSLDISFEELNKPVAYATAYIGLPLPVHDRTWRCHACHHKWEDPGGDDVA